MVAPLLAREVIWFIPVPVVPLLLSVTLTTQAAVPMISLNVPPKVSVCQETLLVDHPPAYTVVPLLVSAKISSWLFPPNQRPQLRVGILLLLSVMLSTKPLSAAVPLYVPLKVTVSKFTP